MDPSGPSLDLEIPLEIIIGTIPLSIVVQQNPPSPPPSYNNFIGFGASASADVTYPTAPPSNLPDLRK